MAQEIAVIGGGVIGTSVAWRLARRGAGRVTLFERERLGAGSSWHSAGNVTWIPGHGDRLATFDLLAEVAAEAGRETGWRRTGRLFLARRQATLEHFRAMAQEASRRGVANALLDAGEAAGRHPLLAGDRLAGAWFNSLSGRVNPADLVAAYGAAARRRGAAIAEETPVRAVAVRGGRVAGVVTGDGEAAFDSVVVCCGLWSRRLLAPLGLALPQWGCQHFYVIARPPRPLERTCPSFVCPDDLIYGREEVGDLLLGCFDEEAVTLAGDGAPADGFAFSLLPENWEKFAPYAERAARHFPALASAPIRRFVNGPEAFTPDGEALVGPFGAIRGLFVASAMNSAGVTDSALAGEAIADAVTGAENPRLDTAPWRPDRFGERARDEGWLRRGASAAVSAHYRAVFGEEEDGA